MFKPRFLCYVRCGRLYLLLRKEKEEADLFVVNGVFARVFWIRFYFVERFLFLNLNLFDRKK